MNYECNECNDTYYLGTELKFAVTIDCRGFSPDRDPWTATLKNGKNTLVCDRTQNTIVDENGQWYLLVDTALLGAGTTSLIVEIDVPDDDFPDGYRHEVYKQDLMTIKRT